MGELRVRKIQEFIKQEVSKMLLNELKDPRIGFVTVTDARITGDLRDATIYVSLFGDDEAKKKDLRGLEARYRLYPDGSRQTPRHPLFAVHCI